MKMTPPVIALMIFLGAIALYVGGVNPLTSSLKRTRETLEADETALLAMQSEVTMNESMTARAKELEATNAEDRKRWLVPMLNSYAMRGKSILDAMAIESGLTNVEYTEGTFRALPIPKPQLPERRTARRSVTVKAVGDYAAAASFVLRVERDLKTVTLQSLTIAPVTAGNNRQSDVQTITMVFEWPCEGEVIK